MQTFGLAADPADCNRQLAECRPRALSRINVMRKELAVFISVCFGISLVSAGTFALLGGRYASLTGTVFASAYMLIPLVSVLVTQLICREKVFSHTGLSFRFNKWWIIAWLGTPLLTVGAMLLSAVMPGTELCGQTEAAAAQMEAFAAQGLVLSPWGLFLITLASAYMAGITVNVVFAFGEEAAWRGYLQHILGDMGFWQKSLLIGLIWGIWHAPLILMGHNYPEHPAAGVFMMVAFCVLFTPVITFLREKSGSVVVAAIVHGMLNATAGFSLMYLTTRNDLLYGSTGLAGMLVLLLADIIILLSQKKRQSGKSRLTQVKPESASHREINETQSS